MQLARAVARILMTCYGVKGTPLTPNYQTLPVQIQQHNILAVTTFKKRPPTFCRVPSVP